MPRIQLLLIVISAIVLNVCSLSAQNAQMEPIFNGNSLNGWIEPDNNIYFSANDGILSVKNGPDLKGSILWTEKEYKDFIIQLDFKFLTDTVDSGVFLRSDDQQIQIGISGSLKKDMTASPYIPGKKYPVEAQGVKELLKLDDWNTMKIKVVESDYTVWLNGDEVMTYTSENTLEKGPIGLQLHGNRIMEIDYRNIMVEEI